MPPTLPTLDDPILRLIGYYLNDHNFLPLPSFGPFWKNLARPAPGSYSKNLRAFRAVSRRVRAVAKLEGLHVSIKSVEKMRAWIWDAPEEMKHAVRRLVLDIRTPKIKWESSPCIILELFDTVLHLLGDLVALEELEIYDLPCCAHREDAVFPIRFRSAWEIRWPAGLQLIHIKALALYIRCQPCHRKIVGDSGESQGCLSAFSTISSTSRRLGALSLITRLFIRHDLGEARFALESIHSTCPGLVELHLAPCHEGAFYISDYFEKHYNFRMTNWSHFWPEEHPVDGWELLSKPDVFPVLRKFKALKVLDLADEVILEESDGIDMMLHGTTARVDFKPQQFEQASARRLEALKRHEVNMKEAQKVAAMSLVENCPSLRRGWWWRTQCLEGQTVYERRGWTATGSGDELVIELDEGVQWLPPEFTDHEKFV